jgi:hypothetical protein
VASKLRRTIERLPGLPLAAVWVSFADELVLELGRLVEEEPPNERQVGEWRLGALSAGWGVRAPDGETLFPRPLADKEPWGLAATRAFDPLLGRRIESLEHCDDWRLCVRFEGGFRFVVEPENGRVPDWQIGPPRGDPYIEGGPGRRVALMAEPGLPPLELVVEPLGLIRR